MTINEVEKEIKYLQNNKTISSFYVFKLYVFKLLLDIFSPETLLQLLHLFPTAVYFFVRILLLRSA